MQRKAYEKSRKAAIKIKSIEVERVHTYIVLKLQAMVWGYASCHLREVPPPQGLKRQAYYLIWVSLQVFFTRKGVGKRN